MIDESIQTTSDHQQQQQPSKHYKHRLSSHNLCIYASYAECIRGLDQFYGQAKRLILKHQSSTTGLYPAESKDRHEASIRDSIYCSLAIWSLYQAYIRRIDDSNGKICELGQSVVKCMRGILFAWMRHAKHRLEVFKTNQNPNVSLPSRVNLVTSLPLDDLNGHNNNDRHLQLDIVSLYLLSLVQMIHSGLQIIYTMDEVHFIQNLVYYIERTYRTPDYGMWELGSLHSPNVPEIHASSIGMAKSALESINGINLFGDKGAAWSVIHVDIDAHSRNRRTFETLLPRESISKNTDASLLPTISWPCFATHDNILYNSTKERLVQLLRTPYGFKRFQKDSYGYNDHDHCGHGHNYSYQELNKYENIECSWPIFHLFMIIDAIFKSNEQQLNEYKEILFDKLLRRHNEYGDLLVPKYYYVPKEYMESERINPNSLPRFSSFDLQSNDCGHGHNGNNGNGHNNETQQDDEVSLYMMGQSLLLIAQLLMNGYLDIKELDPIRRYSPSFERNRKTMTTTMNSSLFQGKLYGIAAELVIQVVLISESIRLKTMMATYGIQTQTPLEVEPVKIWSSSQLVKIYEYLGINEKLGLKGRPPRPIGSLGTSKLYRILGRTILCYPLIFDNQDFYLSNDMSLLIDDIKNELNFIGKFWRMNGRPTVCILLREENLRDYNFKEMLNLLVELKQGYLRDSGLKIKTGRLQNLINSSSIEHLDFTVQFSKELEKLPLLFRSFRQQQHVVDLNSNLFELLLLDNPHHSNVTNVNKQRLSVINGDGHNNYDYHHYHREFESKSTHELLELLKQLIADNQQSSLFKQCHVLSVVMKREGQNYRLQSIMDNAKLIDLIENIYKHGVRIRCWQLVRFCCAMLKKFVDSISPNMTSILVNQKQITIGTGANEVLIDYPRTPIEIYNLLYQSNEQNIYDCVLQQEIIIYVGHLISTSPQLFDGIFKIRIGTGLIPSMRFYLLFKQQNENIDESNRKSLESLSPSELRQILYQLLTNIDNLTPLQQRQINGSLGRFPGNFNLKLWEILKRTRYGISIGHNFRLSSLLCQRTSSHSLDFINEIENFILHVPAPEYRQILIELLMVMYTIFERNPELHFNFDHSIDLDELVELSLKQYRPDGDPRQTILEFYQEDKHFITSYFARAIVNKLLQNPKHEECKIS